MKQDDLKHPFKIGENYLIRTVTMTLVGKLEAVYESELVLSTASWIADTGRFHEALEKGLENTDKSEIERFNSDVVLGRGALIDSCVYKHNLPTQSR